MRTALAFLFQAFLLFGVQTAAAEERQYPATYARIDEDTYLQMFSVSDDCNVGFDGIIHIFGKNYMACWSFVDDKTLLIKVHGHTITVDQSKIEVEWETIEYEEIEMPPIYRKARRNV